jgi:phosphatidylinositol 4-kinase
LIVETVALMLAAEFPSFKGPPTIDRLMQRFRTDLSEKKAAEYMMSVIDNACENARSIVYDEFQYRTNGEFSSLTSRSWFSGLRSARMD